MVVRVGETIPRDQLIRWLTEHGYTRLDAVEDAGDYAARGGDRRDVYVAGEAAAGAD